MWQAWINLGTQWIEPVIKVEYTFTRVNTCTRDGPNHYTVEEYHLLLFYGL